jgi:tripeptidyl-peptidase-1
MLLTKTFRFMKLGLQGHSVFFASGDTGVAGAPRPLLGKDRCLGPNNTIFSPAWPNTCPYVTNVGATKVFPNHSVRDPESAVVDLPGHPWRVAYSSGGGFSNIYARPDYQKHAVTNLFPCPISRAPSLTSRQDVSDWTLSARFSLKRRIANILL